MFQRLPNVLVIILWVMLCKVIGVVFGTLLLQCIKLFPCHPISQSVVSHILMFGTFLIDLVSDETMGCEVLGFKLCWLLNMIEYFKDLPH